MNNPLVSIILTSYNQFKKLEIALNSLLAQTYDNIEIIIVDDFSTDESRDYIEQEASKNKEKIKFFFQHKNVGIPKNKNTGFKLAKGDYVTYLDGDDYYLPNKIELEVDFLVANPTYDIVYSNFYIEEEQTREKKIWIKDVKNANVGKITESVFLRQFPYNSLYRFELMKRKVLEDINYLDEKLQLYEDWDSRIRYSQKFLVGFCENIGSVYFVNSNSISRKSNYIKHFFIKELIYLKNKKSISSDTYFHVVNKNLGNQLLDQRRKLIPTKINSTKNLLKQFALLKKIDFEYLIKLLFDGKF